MLYDFFPFFNELELLEMRLSYLDPIVDRFVLVESNKTSSGEDKPFFYEENKHRFKRWEHKIEAVKNIFPPHVNSTWPRDRYQRAYIACSETWKTMRADDYAIVSDLDEIPSREAIQYVLDNNLGQNLPIVLKILMCRYMINLAETSLWTGITILSGKLKDLNPNPVHDYFAPQYLRTISLSNSPKVQVFPGKVSPQGWHFSYFGGVDRVIKKLQSAAHQELNTPSYTNQDYVRKCIDDGICCCSGVQLHKINYLEFPAEILEVARRYGFIC